MLTNTKTIEVIVGWDATNTKEEYTAGEQVQFITNEGKAYLKLGNLYFDKALLEGLLKDVNNMQVLSDKLAQLEGKE